MAPMQGPVKAIFSAPLSIAVDANLRSTVLNPQKDPSRSYRRDSVFAVAKRGREFRWRYRVALRGRPSRPCAKTIHRSE
jgi:hypothetical protein